LVSEHLYVGVPFRAVAMFKGPSGYGKATGSHLALSHRSGFACLIEFFDGIGAKRYLAVRYVVAEACLQCVDDEAESGVCRSASIGLSGDGLDPRP
jgi:hypothetical protein